MGVEATVLVLEVVVPVVPVAVGGKDTGLKVEHWGGPCNTSGSAQVVHSLGI